MLGLKHLRCSFCRKNASQVEKLVAGPRAYTGAKVYICDACVAIASQIMNEPPRDDQASGAQRVSILHRVSDYVRRFIPGGHKQRIAFPAS